MSQARAGNAADTRREVPLPRLHVVTDDSMLGRGGWAARAAEVLEAGGADVCLHLRGPRTEGATLHDLATELLPHARRAGARLVVNDRVDVALAVEVDGVHLGGRSLPVGVTRGLLGDGRWLGASCHDASSAAAARREGADYVFLGTIFPTPSHTDVAGMGLEGLAATLARLEAFPVIGIGGIDAARVPSVLATGAYGVAVVRGIWDGRDPASAVRRYVEAIGAHAVPMAAPRK
ncbi:MAG TPA: thiamine phosphate synthase [Longimicrobiales bacterium]|nr:thiamine phosphate synthase [Longimicrobiales bacterium]